MHRSKTRLALMAIAAILLLAAGCQSSPSVAYKELLDEDAGVRSDAIRKLGDAKLVEAIYAGDDETDLEIAVTYQDGRQGVLKTTVRVSDVENASKAAKRQSKS